MKKVIFAAIAFIGLTATGFAQTTPTAKKAETAKTQTVKKSATKKTDMAGHKKAKAHKKHNSK